MRVVKCLNNHFYDADKYATCPQCGATMGYGDPAAGAAPQSAPAAEAPGAGETFGVFKKKSIFKPKRDKASANSDNYDKLKQFNANGQGAGQSTYSTPPQPAMNANSLLGNAPVQASQPAAQPVQAFKPAPAQPAPQPAQPIQAFKPAPAAQPAQPAQPIQAFKPAPAQPVQTAAPVQPASQPAQPIQAFKPAPAAQPAQPAQPIQAFKPAPAQPAAPVQTAAPAQPVQAAPAQPAQPVKQEQPKPVQPSAAAPVKPAEPAAPVKDETPVDDDQEPKDSLLEEIKKVSADNDGKTVGFFSAGKLSSTEEAEDSGSGSVSALNEPVVGWLVCVKGPNFGQSFGLCAGKNSLGRSNTNVVIISKDRSVSRDKHSWIIYEPKSGSFYVQPGESSGLTYVNGEVVLQPTKLEKKSIIEVGNTQLLLFPLCGEDFSWEEYL